MVNPGGTGVYVFACHMLIRPSNGHTIHGICVVVIVPSSLVLCSRVLFCVVLLCLCFRVFGINKTIFRDY